MCLTSPLTKGTKAEQLKFCLTHHEELTQGDVGEDVVGFIFATSDPALLPEV